MPTPADYVAAATLIAEGPVPGAEAPAAVVPPEPPPTPASATGTEGTTVAENPVLPEGDKKEVSPPADKKPEPTRIEKGFEDLARERAAFRAEREAAKPQLESARAMTEAAQRGDAMALLAAARIPWSQAARQVLEGHGTKSPQNEKTDEVDPRDARLAALEKEIATTKEQAARANLMTQLKSRSSKYPHLSALEAEHEAMAYIERYYNETQQLPGQTLDETLEIALEAVEAVKAKEAKRWEGVLTKLRPGAVVPSSKTAVPAAGATSQQAATKTLTNDHGSGPRSASNVAPKQPKTAEEYQLAALEALTAQ